MLSTYPRSLVLLSVRIPLHLKLFWNLHVRHHPLMISECLAEKYRKLSSRSWKAVRIFSPLNVQDPVFHHFAPPFQMATLHCYSRWKIFWKKLLSLWPSLSPGICFFLSPSLSPHSYSLLVPTFIKLAQPPVGGGGIVAAPPLMPLLVILLASSSFPWLTENTQVSIYPVDMVSGNSLYSTHGS